MNTSPFFDFREYLSETIDIILIKKQTNKQTNKQKTVNVGFFSDTIKAKSFKLCMIISMLGIYIVILGLMTLTMLKDYSCVRHKTVND